MAALLASGNHHLFTDEEPLGQKTGNVGHLEHMIHEDTGRCGDIQGFLRSEHRDFDSDIRKPDQGGGHPLYLVSDNQTEIVIGFLQCPEIDA